MRVESSKKIVSVDIEGNGVSPAEIVEIAIVTIENRIITKIKTWLIRPENSIHWRATKIHGITNKDVLSCPSFSQVEKEILETLGESYLMSHNNHVEKNILQRYIPEWKPLGYIDTLKLSRKKIKNRESYKLSDLASFLGIDKEAKDRFGDNKHRADYDAFVTALLYFYLCDISDSEYTQGSLF